MDNSASAQGLLEHAPEDTGAAPGGVAGRGGVGESSRDDVSTVAFQHLAACLRGRESRLPGPVSELSSADSPGAPFVPRRSGGATCPERLGSHRLKAARGVQQIVDSVPTKTQPAETWAASFLFFF